MVLHVYVLEKGGKEMSVLGFIGLVLLITVFVGIYITFLKGATSGKQATPDCSCKLCETPEVDHEWHELKAQPKVYTLDCSACVWRHPSTCKHCAIERKTDEVTQLETTQVDYGRT